MIKRTSKQRTDKAFRYTSIAFRPHAIALGQLALAWNGLHETLMFLFCSVMGGGVVNQFTAVWHAINSDRAQREILLSAVKHDYQGMRPIKFFEDIQWLCKRIDALEETRNNALHSPLYAYRRSHDETVVMPLAGLGHVRANKLAERNLLSEFRWCRDSAIALGVFAAQMDRTLCDLRVPWPDRPKLPNRGDTNAQKPVSP